MIMLHIFIKKVELECVVNVDTIKQEKEEDKLSKNNVDEDKINPYCNIIINNIDKESLIDHKWNKWFSSQ